MIGRNLYCEYPNDAHGNPVIKCAFANSSDTHRNGATKGRGMVVFSEMYFVKYPKMPGYRPR